ncbi:MAG: 4-(cytidine 5'-diphospho)-2-C-methyl-D-erythritol kinase [Phycisphaerae bacterium]|nr:4-(cytidine 5'-diphospho)-2-C-methyl-D-erythritol kinase [Phycisphaerae bacterium]
MVASAPAKINWTLDLLERRSDGYHELETVASSLDWGDELTFAPQPDSADVTITCNDTSVPTDERNLVHKAAMRLARRAGVREGAAITLNKRIPAGAGLGGGSSDAAATLRGLNVIWGLHWPTPQLLPLAATVGSDVPLLLVGGTAIARGRGEFVEPIPFAWAGWVTLAMPNIHVATPTVYAHVRPDDLRPSADGSRAFADRQATARWTALELLEHCRNGLEAPAFRGFGALADLHAELQRRFGRPWRLCGSGSTFFTAWDSAEEAAECVKEVRAVPGIRAEATRLETNCVEDSNYP